LISVSISSRSSLLLDHDNPVVIEIPVSGSVWTQMPSISFWLVALGLPLAAVVVNSFARWLVQLPQSAPADTILAFVVFDLVVLIQRSDFIEHIGHEAFRVNFTPIYGILIFLGTFLWALTVFFIETKIAKYYRWTARRFSYFPFVPFFFSLFFPVILFFASIAPFVYRG
jgi:hypothetical protein